MKTNRLYLSSTIAAITIMLAGTLVHAAGFQQGVAADPGGKPLVIGIWYPSQTMAKPVSMGPTTMSVALNAPMNGKALPTIVMSHGTGGSYLGHLDTAIALADAGFVVVAMSHTGDNYADQSRSVDIMDRPRQVSRVIDHMLSTWEGRAAIDPQRIGMFGFSSGGFTTLAIIGGVPDFTKIGPMCQQYPGDFACQLLTKSENPVVAAATIAVADARIKSAVVAAPALGFTFSPDGLKSVKVPVQLWRAENDVLQHPAGLRGIRERRVHDMDEGREDRGPASGLTPRAVARSAVRSLPGRVVGAVARSQRPQVLICAWVMTTTPHQWTGLSTASVS